jgi:hypothetical protein
MQKLLARTLGCFGRVLPAVNVVEYFGLVAVVAASLAASAVSAVYICIVTEALESKSMMPATSEMIPSSTAEPEALNGPNTTWLFNAVPSSLLTLSLLMKCRM